MQVLQEAAREKMASQLAGPGLNTTPVVADTAPEHRESVSSDVGQGECSSQNCLGYELGRVEQHMCLVPSVFPVAEWGLQT